MKQIFSEELLAAARKTASVEELIKLAAENGMELDASAADDFFAKIHPVNEALSDSELDNVSGGGCNSPASDAPVVKEPSFYPGQKVYLCNSGHTFGSRFCRNPKCGSAAFKIVKQINDTGTYLIECMGCDWTYHAVKENMR